MNEIKQLAVIGAGAIGSAFVKNAMDNNENVIVIADGDRADRLKSNGLTVDGRLYRPKIISASDAGIQDLIIISTKYTALDSAIECAKLMTGPDTIILSVLNGIDSEERVAEAVGKEHILHSLIHFSSRRYADHIEVQQAENQGILFGNVWMTEPQGTKAVEAVRKFFDRAGIKYTLPENILFSQWHKYASNVAYNLPQAIVDCGTGIYFDSEHAQYMVAQLWKEAVNLARTYGIVLPAETKPWKVANNTRFSTLQDLDAKRPTEIAMFAGVLAEKSKAAGLIAPCAEYTYHIIKLLEEKNSGKFEY